MTTGRINQIARVVLFSPLERERKGPRGPLLFLSRVPETGHAFPSFLLRRQGSAGSVRENRARDPPARAFATCTLFARAGPSGPSRRRNREPDATDLGFRTAIPFPGTAPRVGLHTPRASHTTGGHSNVLEKGGPRRRQGKTTHQRRAEVFPGLPSSQPRRPHRGLN